MEFIYLKRENKQMIYFSNKTIVDRNLKICKCIVTASVVHSNFNSAVDVKYGN